jgi:hypothetical protein
MNIGAEYMKENTLRMLRVAGLILGWLLLAGALMGVWNQVALYQWSDNDPPGLYGSVPFRFDFARALGSFFSIFGNAFFAFLIAAVLRMIERRAPVEDERAQRLMIVCCLSYVAEFVIKLGSFTLGLGDLSSLPLAGSHFLRFWIPCLVTAIPVLIPAFYAATILVLYTHFTNMVTFESEVA